MQFDNYLFGFVIPVYNTADFLYECLISIKNQSYFNFIAIVVNDGSTDNSTEIIRNTINNDKRFVLINKLNGGLSSARNEGLEFLYKMEKKVDYISFLDSDDYVESNFLEKLTEDLASNTDLVYPDLIVFNYKINKNNNLYNNPDFRYIDSFTNISPLKIRYLLDSKYYFPQFVWNKIYSMEKLIEKKLFFDINAKIGEDFLFNLNYFNSLNKISFLLSDYLYVYRKNPQSITNKKVVNFSDLTNQTYIINMTIEFLINHSFKTSLVYKTIVDRFFYLTLRLIKNPNSESLFLFQKTSESFNSFKKLKVIKIAFFYKYLFLRTFYLLKLYKLLRIHK
jgi:glycosyltransferase involved in cell wall biosynthesis